MTGGWDGARPWVLGCLAVLPYASLALWLVVWRPFANSGLGGIAIMFYGLVLLAGTGVGWGFAMRSWREMALPSGSALSLLLVFWADAARSQPLDLQAFGYALEGLLVLGGVIVGPAAFVFRGRQPVRPRPL